MDLASELFPPAQTYPEFFNINLVDPNRVIKIVEGKFCAVRAFYYQLLKLIFQIDAAKDETLTTHMQRMLNNCSPHDDYAYLRDQVRSVHMFMEAVIQTGQTQFQTHLNNHRQADTALVTVFTHILRQQNLQNASVEEKIGYLCQLFNLRATQLEKCLKFQQSDVFIYVQNQKLLYLAYLVLDQPDQLVENSIDRGIYQNRNQYDDRNQKKGKNNDTIINIFGDMLHSSKHDGESKYSNSFLTNNLNSSLSPGKKEQEVLTSMKGKQKYPFESEKAPDVYDYSKTSEDQKFMKHESNVEIYKTISKNSRTKQSKPELSPQDVIYRPKSKLPTISEVTSSKQSLIYSHRYKKDPLDMVDDEEKGTFYRQFTNTRILNILPEPQRTNVKMLRNRFIGVHSRDLKKQ